MLAIDRVAVPVLLRVTMVGELVVATNCEVNATELGARPPSGAGVTPVPISVTV
jgi:hypothetical protein